MKSYAGSRVGDPGGTKGGRKALSVLVGLTVHHHPLSLPLSLALIISPSLPVSKTYDDPYQYRVYHTKSMY